LADNNGFDRNVDHVIRCARGEFVALLGDDDYYQGEDSIGNICNLLEKNRDSKVFLLRSMFLDIQTQKISPNSLVKWNTEIQCTNGDDFFEKSGWGIDPVSALIVNRSEWVCKDFSLGYGNQWLHNYAVALLLSDIGTSVLALNPVVVIRTANPRWNSNGNYYLLRLKQLRCLLDGMRSGYNNRTIDHIKFDGASISLRRKMMSAPIEFGAAIACIRLIRSIYAPNLRWILDSAIVVEFSLLRNVYKSFRFIFSRIRWSK
jgi:hypothetical protein